MNGTGQAGAAVRIVGTGSYLPERVLGNDELARMVETSDEWIRERTGIRERRIAAAGEMTSDLSAVAARRALEAAGLTPEEVDVIAVATISPDMGFPNTACFVQSAIGAKNAYCFDLEAACSGFLYTMETVRHMVASGAVNNALVIGGEKLSCITDWQDRGTCILFGDGAGAVVLRRSDEGRGILGSVMGSDGSLAELLNLPGGGCRHPASEESVRNRLHYMKMNGREVFKHAVRCMSDAGMQVLSRAGLTIQDINWVLPHQANMRIVSAIANRIDCPIEKFVINLERVGNLSAASVPVALDEAVRSGRVKRGDLVLMVVFGGGFTWGSMLVEM